MELKAAINCHEDLLKRFEVRSGLYTRFLTLAGGNQIYVLLCPAPSNECDVADELSCLMSSPFLQLLGEVAQSHKF